MSLAVNVTCDSSQPTVERKHAPDGDVRTTMTDCARILETTPAWLDLAESDSRRTSIVEHLAPLLSLDEQTVLKCCREFLKTYQDDPENFEHRASVVLLVNRLYFDVPADDPMLWPLQEVGGDLQVAGGWLTPAEYYMWELEFLDFSDRYGRRKEP
jgi:hypothetical protein